MRGIVGSCALRPNRKGFCIARRIIHARSYLSALIKERADLKLGDDPARLMVAHADGFRLDYRCWSGWPVQGLYASSYSKNADNGEGSAKQDTYQTEQR